MSTLQYKLCPQCKNAAPLDAVQCLACRRKFRSTSPQLPSAKGLSQTWRWVIILSVVAFLAAAFLVARTYFGTPQR